MGIKNIGSSIRQARMLAGLTQEQLSEGICTPLSLSRIENNKAGIRPETFQLLMERTGRSCPVSAAFIDQKAFQAFLAMESVFFAISSGNPRKAYQELSALSASQELSENPYFYQRFQLAQVSLQLLCEDSDYNRLLDMLSRLLQMTHPDFHIERFPGGLLSVTDIRLLLKLCEVFLHTGRENLCLNYCNLLQDSISFVDKTYFCSAISIYRFEALLALGEDVLACFDELNRLYYDCVRSHVSNILPQLYSSLGLCLFLLGEKEKAIRIFKICYLSARSVNHVFSSFLYRRLKDNYGIEFLTKEESADLLPRPTLPWLSIPSPVSALMDEPAAEYTYRLGNIIHDLREAKKSPSPRSATGYAPNRPCPKSRITV